MRFPAVVAQGLQTMFVQRREPEVGARSYGENIQIDNAPVLEEPQGSPDPIRQSMFSGVGRAPTEQWASVPVAIHLNIKPIQSVMADNFLTGKIQVGQSALLTNGLGGQTAWTDRQNIDPGRSEPYGNRVAVGGANQTGVFEAHGLSYGGRRRV